MLVHTARHHVPYASQRAVAAVNGMIFDARIADDHKTCIMQCSRQEVCLENEQQIDWLQYDCGATLLAAHVAITALRHHGPHQRQCMHANSTGQQGRISMMSSATNLTACGYIITRHSMWVHQYYLCVLQPGAYIHTTNARWSHFRCMVQQSCLIYGQSTGCSHM